MPTRIAHPADVTGVNAQLPSWLTKLLDSASLSPVAGLDLPAGAIDASTRVGGRQVMDWLGDILQTQGQKGVPSRVRITGMDPTKATMSLSGKAGGQPMEVGMHELSELLDSGEVMRQGATATQPSVDTLVKKLLAVLGQSPAGQ